MTKINHKLIREAASQWSLTTAERRALHAYFHGTQSCASYDRLTDSIKAAVNTYDKLIASHDALRAPRLTKIERKRKAAIKKLHTVIANLDDVRGHFMYDDDAIKVSDLEHIFDALNHLRKVSF